VTLVIGVLVALVLAVLVFLAVRNWGELEQKATWFSFVAHLLSAGGQLAMVRFYYSGGDMVHYLRSGSRLVSLMERDFARLAPEVLALTFRTGDVRLPTMETFMAGSPTGSMMGLTAWAEWLVGGNALAVCVVFAGAALLGKVALYRAFRSRIDEGRRPAAVAACLLVPSLVFWSSGVLKEAVAIAGFGTMVLGLALVLEKRLLLGLLAAVVGAVLVHLVKPYILAAFAGAGTLWLVSAQAAARGRDLQGRHVVLGIGAALLGLFAVGQILPQFSIAELGSALDRLQTIGQRVTGGSGYSLGGADASLPSQLALAPLALLTALFRPLLIESSSVLIAAGALETTVFLVLAVRGVARRGSRATVALVLGDPELLFSLMFVLLFGVAVGLASTNLGSLARYRIPLLPFFVFLLLCINRDDPGTQT